MLARGRPAAAGINGVRDLHLVVTDGGDGGYNDRADWVDLTVA